MTVRDDAVEAARETLIRWQEMGMCKIPARDGARRLIQDLEESGFQVVKVVKSIRQSFPIEAEQQ